MIIYNDEKKKRKKIYHKDLQRMSIRIDEFIDLYTKKIYIKDKEHYRTLNILKEISTLIKQGQYDKLIEDTSIISYEEPPEEMDYSDAEMIHPF